MSLIVRFCQQSPAYYVYLHKGIQQTLNGKAVLTKLYTGKIEKGSFLFRGEEIVWL